MQRRSFLTRLGVGLVGAFAAKVVPKAEPSYVRKFKENSIPTPSSPIGYTPYPCSGVYAVSGIYFPKVSYTGVHYGSGIV